MDDLEERLSELRAREELESLRPELDGVAVMAELGIFAAVDSPVQFAFDRTEASGLAASGLPGGQVLTLSLSAADELVGQPSTDLVAAHLDALRGGEPLRRFPPLFRRVDAEEAASLRVRYAGTVRG
jgi:hypothetical protein